MGGRRPVIRLTDKQSQKKQWRYGMQFIPQVSIELYQESKDNWLYDFHKGRTPEGRLLKTFLVNIHPFLTHREGGGGRVPPNSVALAQNFLRGRADIPLKDIP